METENVLPSDHPQSKSFLASFVFFPYTVLSPLSLENALTYILIPNHRENLTYNMFYVFMLCKCSKYSKTIYTYKNLCPPSLQQGLDNSYTKGFW